MKTRLYTVLQAEVGEWSQAELCYPSRVTHETINAIKTGRSNPSTPPWLSRITARLFGKHVEEMFLDQESRAGNIGEYQI